MLKVTLIQTNLVWEDIDKNLARLNDKIDSVNEITDLIVLPEMFTTGFTMNPKEFSEEPLGKGFKWMLEKAKAKNCAIVGSIAVNDNGLYYNRLYWVNSNGTFYKYDKKHLFSMGNEPNHYTEGSEKLIIEYKGWKICPLICYDLRFPAWSRNAVNNTYDLLIYVANWPAARRYPWKQLLIARAIENQSYVVGVNRVGEDVNNFNHTGDSLAIDAKGEIIASLEPSEECIETVILSKKNLSEFRSVFPVLNDADKFSLDY